MRTGDVAAHGYLDDEIAAVAVAANAELDKQGKCCSRAEHGQPCMCSAREQCLMAGMVVIDGVAELVDGTRVDPAAFDRVADRLVAEQESHARPWAKLTAEERAEQFEREMNKADVPYFSGSDDCDTDDDTAHYAALQQTDSDTQMVLCQRCKKLREFECERCGVCLVCCECDEEPEVFYCEYCGDEDIACYCCPTNAHSVFDDYACDCMTEEEKADRVYAIDERLDKLEEERNSTMFSLTEAFNKSDGTPKICPEHLCSPSLCESLSHQPPQDGTAVAWCKHHDKPQSVCKSWYHHDHPENPIDTGHVNASLVNAEKYGKLDENGVWKAGTQQSLPLAPIPPTFCTCPSPLPKMDSDGKCVKCKMPDKQHWTSNQAGIKSSSTTSTITKWESHTHKPTMVIDGKDEGWSVWVGKKDDCAHNTKGFGLVMNLTGYTIKTKHVITVPELAKWNSNVQCPEMLMDWPDMKALDMPLEFWMDLADHIKSNKIKFLTFCVGGHGRTGTALACLLIVMLGWDADKAAKWIKKSYCGRAIESPSQEQYIEDIYEAKLEHDKAAKQ